MARKIIITGMGITMLLGWIVIGQWGCEWTPERDNSLDPNSDMFSPILTGEVTNLAGIPIAEAIVTLNPEGKIAATGSDGNYLFEGVNLGEYTLTVQKAGHVDDTTQIHVIFGGTNTQDFQLNALPQFDSVRVTSHYIRFIPNYIYVTIEAWIINADGSPSEDSVLTVFEEDTLGHLDIIQSIGNYGVFSYDFDTDSAFSNINHNSFELIIGKPFVLIAYDSQGGFSVSEPHQLIRFLEPPFTNHPRDLETASQTPTLDWDQYDAEFEFLQNARIFDDLENLIWDSLGIPSTMIQVTVTDTLQHTGAHRPVSYYWTLEIEDMFSNTSTSEKLHFRVE